MIFEGVAQKKSNFTLVWLWGNYFYLKSVPVSTVLPSSTVVWLKLLELRSLNGNWESSRRTSLVPLQLAISAALFVELMLSCYFTYLCIGDFRMLTYFLNFLVFLLCRFQLIIVYIAKTHTFDVILTIFFWN